MVIWVFLALLVIGASFILALRSMGDYQERPHASSLAYSLFLIGKPEALTDKLVAQLYEIALKGVFIFSFERLFRGSKRALVIFGASSLLQPFTEALGLTEIEEYAHGVSGSSLAWEVGTRDSNKVALEGVDLVSAIPKLQDKEQVWWQLVLQPQKGNPDAPTFKAAIRVVFETPDKKRIRQLEPEFARIGQASGLVFLPQSYPSHQIIKFYRERSLPLAPLSEKGSTLELTCRQVISLLGL